MAGGPVASAAAVVAHGAWPVRYDEQSLDEAREDREEELAERDRVAEKAPAEDALFGGDGFVSQTALTCGA